jgi:hypothetical protein
VFACASVVVSGALMSAIVNSPAGARIREILSLDPPERWIQAYS